MKSTENVFIENLPTKSNFLPETTLEVEEQRVYFSLKRVHSQKNNHNIIKSVGTIFI